MKNMLVEFLLKMFGLGDKSMVEKLIRGALLGGGGSQLAATASDGEAAPAGGNPLEKLMGQFKDKGLGNIFQSWVGGGKNEAVTPDQIKAGVGDEQMTQMAQKAGLPTDVLAGKLAKYLPGLIDKMTPGGKLPGRSA